MHSYIITIAITGNLYCYFINLLINYVINKSLFNSLKVAPLFFFSLNLFNAQREKMKL